MNLTKRLRRTSGSPGGGFERTLVYVNPSAGSGRGSRAWNALLAAEPALSGSRLILETASEVGSRALGAALSQTHDSRPHRVIVVGGDGTTQLVAEQLLRSGKGKNISFGLVPAGTGSDLARGLRLPTRPVPALRHLLSCQPRPFDLIRLRRDSGEERLSINVASAGVSGAVALAVNARPNRGQIPYLRATIQALFRYQPTPCRIWVDGELFYQGDFFVLAVANGRFFGKGMQVAPQGRTDDGLAEVVLVPPLPLWQLPYRLPLFIAGQHPRWAGVLHTRARSLRIEPMGDMPPFELDGETLAAGPAELTLLPGALRILA